MRRPRRFVSRFGLSWSVCAFGNMIRSVPSHPSAARSGPDLHAPDGLPRALRPRHRSISRRCDSTRARCSSVASTRRSREALPSPARSRGACTRRSARGRDGGVSRATTACRARAHDAYDPDDPSDDRSRWWRSVVTPFHDARPRPSPGPVAPALARDFTLQLDDAEVGARRCSGRGLVDARRACVLLREPFETARTAHELPPRRLPSVVDACGAARGDAALGGAARVPRDFSALPYSFRHLRRAPRAPRGGGLERRLRKKARRSRVPDPPARCPPPPSDGTPPFERATRLARPPLPLRRRADLKAPLGAWRVRRLLRERSAGRPPFLSAARETRSSTPAGAGGPARGRRRVPVRRAGDVGAESGGRRRRGRRPVARRRGRARTGVPRGASLAFETALGVEKRETKPRARLPRRAADAPARLRAPLAHTCAARDSGGWDSTSSCAMTDVPSGTRRRAGDESSARNASSRKTSSRDGFGTPVTCFAASPRTSVFRKRRAGGAP